MIAPGLVAVAHIQMAEWTTAGVRLRFRTVLQSDVRVEIMTDGFGATRTLLVFALLGAFTEEMLGVDADFDDLKGTRRLTDGREFEGVLDCTLDIDEASDTRPSSALRDRCEGRRRSSRRRRCTY